MYVYEKKKTAKTDPVVLLGTKAPRPKATRDDEPLVYKDEAGNVLDITKFKRFYSKNGFICSHAVDPETKKEVEAETKILVYLSTGELVAGPVCKISVLDMSGAFESKYIELPVGGLLRIKVTDESKLGDGLKVFVNDVVKYESISADNLNPSTPTEGVERFLELPVVAGMRKVEIK